MTTCAAHPPRAQGSKHYADVDGMYTVPHGYGIGENTFLLTLPLGFGPNKNKAFQHPHFEALSHLFGVGFFGFTL